MILVRHSQTEMLRDVPPAEWKLSAEGRARAAAMASRLVGLKPDAVCSSPEPKAEETAGIIARALGLDVAMISELAEHDRTGVPFLSSQSEFETNITRFFQHPHERVFGTESAAEALARFQLGIHAACREALRPVVVTHGTVMSLYLAERRGADPFSIWKSLAAPCFSLCHTETGCGEIQYLAEITGRDAS